MNDYFLDSNILISALNEPDSESGKLLKGLLLDSKSKIFISPLVIYEVLRGVKSNEEYAKIKQGLSDIAIINIDSEIAELASVIFKFEREKKAECRQQSKKIDKHNFDIMHFATAKVNKLEILSKDRDIEDWNSIYLSSKAVDKY